MASEIIERDMYAGTIHIRHNPTARGRAPRYLVNGKDKSKGVTSILGQTLAKDLMQWAADCACDYLRGKLPVVTEADLKEAAKAYTVKRDAGGSTGTEAHAMVEAYLKGHQAATGSPEATNAYGAFVRWFEEATPTVINVEEVIYSKELGYAGTYDCLLKIGDKVVLGDYKTTNASRKAPNGIYAENFIQLGAYAAAHEEQRIYEEANGGTNLVKIDDLAVLSGKKNGAFDVVFASDLGLSVKGCGELFKMVLTLHNQLAKVTTMLGGK